MSLIFFPVSLPRPNRNATLDPLGAQVGCKVGPTWAAQVGPTTFCLAGPHGAPEGLPMCHTSGSHLGPTFYFSTGTHFTSKWVSCLNLKVGLPTLVPYGQPNWDPLCFVKGAHFGPIWAIPLGHSHVGPIWDPSISLYGYNLGNPTWAYPCWSQLGPTFIYT